MRISFRLALIGLVSLAFSGQALAAKGGKKKAEPTGPVQTMDSGDPVEKETSEPTAAAPKKKTDEEIEKEQNDREFRLDAAAAKKSHEREKLNVFANVLIGFGQAPEPGEGADKTTGKTTAATILLGGSYDVSPDFTLGLRIPYTIGRERQIDGLYQSGQVLGAPELLAEYRATLSPFTRLPIFFGFGLPLAQGNYDSADHLRLSRLNDFADAASGYRDPELFQPKRLPIIVGVGIDYERKALNLHAATKVVVGVNAGGKERPQTDPVGTFDLKSVSFRNVTSGGIAYQFVDKPRLYGALDSWMAISAINPIEFESFDHAKKPTRFQLVFEPRVGAHFGKISPSVGYIFPIGGRLADTSASGLELHCDVAF